jgi:transposase
LIGYTRLFDRDNAGAHTTFQSEKIGRELKRPVEVVSCYDGFWLHRLLEENGVRNYVIDPARLQVDRRARRVKTDNTDATKLLRSLMAYLRGEPKVWSVVRVLTIAEDDDRRLHIASSTGVSSTSTVSRGYVLSMEVLVVREAAFEHQELGPSRRVKPDRLIWCPALKPNVLAAVAKERDQFYTRPARRGRERHPRGFKPSLRAVLRIELPRA